MSGKRFKHIYFQDGEWQGCVGSSVSEIVKETIDAAGEYGGVLCIKVNDVEISVDKNTDLNLIGRDYQRVMDGLIPKQIGPHPPEVLTREEIAYELFEKARKNRKWAIDTKVSAERLRLTREAMRKRLAETAPAVWKDEALWLSWLGQQSDSMGRETFAFAERWARLMQDAVAQGIPLKCVAKPLVEDVDIEGISGYMYECAVSVLSQCWEHGDVLHEWYKSH